MLMKMNMKMQRKEEMVVQMMKMSEWNANMIILVTQETEKE